VAVDANGNRAESEWSAPYEVVPPLALKAPTPSRPAPRTAGTAVRWQAETSGGIGSRTWSFIVQRGEEEAALLQEGVEPVWNWTPTEPGRYRIRAGVRDAAGNTADSGWSEPYLIVPKPVVTALSVPQPKIAVLPVENLSGTGRAPSRHLRQALMTGLDKAGFTLLGDDLLEQFMTRHRIRYVGGIDEDTAKAFLEETGTDAVLVTSLVLYNETFPPRIALFCRLISTGAKPEIVWMDGVGMAGDESPGLLDLGLIEKPQVLLDKELAFLIGSMSRRLAGGPGDARAGRRLGTYRPKEEFNASFLKKGKKYSVVVIPFSVEGGRSHAGEIMSLHVVRELAARDDFIVMEPGVVRSSMLRMRIILEYGISTNDLYVISNTLGTDLLLTGKASRYEDPNVPKGIPKVDFSLLLMEGAGKKIIWASKDYNQGDDGVFFFDVGRIGTSFEMASLMVRSLMDKLDQRSEAPVKSAPAEADFFKRFWIQQ
jgi:hypothetical protein